MSSKNCHTLVILGNGFDRNCNLDSSFDNFLNACIKPKDNYEYFQGIYDNDSDNKREAQSKQNDIHRDLSDMDKQLKYLEQGIHYKKGKLQGTYDSDNSWMFNTIAQIYDENHNPSFLNFWIYYLYLLRGINIPLNHILWYDIENQISYLCNSIYNYHKIALKNMFFDVNQNPFSIIQLFMLFLNKKYRNRKVTLYFQNKRYTKYPQFFINQFLFQIPVNNRNYINRPLDMSILISFEFCGFLSYLNQSNQSDNSNYYHIFFNFLFNQLEKFEKEFSHYLKVNMHMHKGKYFTRRLAGLNKICDTPYNLLTFNYTGRPGDSNCVSYLPIHSDINHCPIIGINDSECQDDKGWDKDFDIFSKECQIVAYDSENKTLIDIIPKDINCIKIYGHSLSNDDFPYFNKIFNYCDLKSNKIKLIFYYTNYDEDVDHRTKFTQKVFKFMDKYNLNVRKNLWDYHHLEVRGINW